MRIIKNKRKHISNIHALLHNLPRLHYFTARSYIWTRVNYNSHLQFNKLMGVGSTILFSSVIPTILTYYTLAIYILLK